ncbi:MAG: FtsX-like permease family protein [Cyanobacteria bacterium P01_A01_bin.17]
MVSLARKNLFQDLPRFIVAQAGIMFAVGLVSIQTGLLNGFTKSTTLLIENADADLWIASEDMRYLDLTLPIPYERVAQAEAVEGVEVAEALISKGSVWRYAFDQIAPIKIIGFDPDGKLFRPTPLIEGELNQIKQPYRIIVDQLELGSLDIQGVGATADIGSFEAQVSGTTSGLSSIVSSPYVFTSLPNALAYLESPIASPEDNPADPPALTSEGQINFVLVRAEPGQNLPALKKRLESELPDVQALTQAELTELTQTYWRNSTGVGYILGLGAAVGVVVGTVVVGQILYSSVSDHLKEFGTLKAMGSPDWYIYRVILEQALWMAVLGYVPGMALSVGLGAWTAQAQAIAILINPGIAVGVFLITVVMCSGAAIFAIQKVTRLDPAMVFKS